MCLINSERIDLGVAAGKLRNHPTVLWIVGAEPFFLLLISYALRKARKIYKNNKRMLLPPWSLRAHPHLFLLS